MNEQELTHKLSVAVADGDAEESERLVGEAIAANVDPMALVREAIQPAMDIVGKRFECGDAFLPELILAGDAARAALDKIIPQISAEDRAAAQQGTVVIGTMYGDNHDIGKNLVSAILAAHGFKVVDLGINVLPKTYLEAAVKEGAHIIAASTLITTSLPYQRQIVELLKESGQREKFFFIVGGGPVTPEWAREIGADGYGRDANDAAAVCRKLMTQGTRPPLAAPVLEGALKR
jgi:methylmalonyl-CoA mutase cobalamin-binding domain/chain